MSFRIDLHTHSKSSPDSGVTAAQYRHVLRSGQLDCIAITDHDRIEFALELQKELGRDKIIVGEEISTNQGEIIGLFLREEIPAGLDLDEAIKKIKDQNGLIYIPHPYETVRSGITKKALESIKDSVDIIETCNGRAFFQNFRNQAEQWSLNNNVPGAASSDSHRAGALGKTYTEVAQMPTRESLIELLRDARLCGKKPSFLDLLAPKASRIMKKLRIIQ